MKSKLSNAMWMPFLKNNRNGSIIVGFVVAIEYQVSISSDTIKIYIFVLGSKIFTFDFDLTFV